MLNNGLKLISDSKIVCNYNENHKFWQEPYSSQFSSHCYVYYYFMNLTILFTEFLWRKQSMIFIKVYYTQNIIFEKHYLKLFLKFYLNFESKLKFYRIFDNNIKLFYK